MLWSKLQENYITKKYTLAIGAVVKVLLNYDTSQKVHTDLWGKHFCKTTTETVDLS